MSGKQPWPPIKSPKQAESEDGVPERTTKTLPKGAVKKS